MMGRFLITTVRRRSGGRAAVAFRVFEKAGGAVAGVRSVGTGFEGPEESVLLERRTEIVRGIRLFYCLIERRAEAGGVFGVADVVADYRRAVAGDAELAPWVERAGEDFALRPDLVEVGVEYRGAFRFVEAPVEEAVPDTLVAYVGWLARRARGEGRDSRARTLESARRSLERHVGAGDVSLRAVDRAFVSGYSEWLSAEGLTASTQSFYLRALRSVLNQAAREGLTPAGEGLFAGLNTRVLFERSGRERRGLSREALWRIADADLSGDREAEVVRDMFMFAFYCKGMDLTDVVGLRDGCVRDGILTYRRRNGGSVKTVLVDGGAMEIYRRYSVRADGCLFPLVEMRSGLRRYSLNGLVSRALARIAALTGAGELTFGMNIATWRSLVAEVAPASLLAPTAPIAHDGARPQVAAHDGARPQVGYTRDTLRAETPALITAGEARPQAG